MPCYSTITTSFVDIDQLRKAIEKIGGTIQFTRSHREIGFALEGRSYQFERYSETEAFSIERYFPKLDELTQAYGEVAVESFADANGLTYQNLGGGEFELTLLAQSY